MPANLGSVIRISPPFPFSRDGKLIYPVNLNRMETPNTTWSPLAVESQIAIHLPTAYLRKIALTAYFTSIPRPFHNLEPSEESFCCGAINPLGLDEPQKALDLLSLMDAAFIALLKEKLEPIAPCIFRPRYLEVRDHKNAVGDVNFYPPWMH